MRVCRSVEAIQASFVAETGRHTVSFAVLAFICSVANYLLRVWNTRAAGVDGCWNADSGVSPPNSKWLEELSGEQTLKHSIRCPPNISCTVGTLFLTHQQSLSVRPLLDCDTELCRESSNWLKSLRKHRAFTTSSLELSRYCGGEVCCGIAMDVGLITVGVRTTVIFLIGLQCHYGFKWSGIWLSFLWKTADKWWIHIQNKCIINPSSGIWPEISQRFSQKCFRQKNKN